MIHETSIVDAGATIGKNTNIWHWTHVCSGAVIGDQVSIGQNVFVGKNVQIGKGSKIQNNVSLFENVRLMDRVFCGPSVVFTNVINPRAHVERKSEFLRTHVSSGATIGANATIVCCIILGEFCFIGAGSVVTKDVKPYALMVGNPARHVGWMSQYGEKLPFPLKGQSSFFCQKSAHTYRLIGNEILIESG